MAYFNHQGELGEQKGLSAASLKYLACFFMLIDHIGFMLLPQYFFLRGIGRLAFPIFAFMIANGYRHTSNPAKYLLRLAVFAIGFQWFYAQIMHTNNLSIFATLALGLLAIWLADMARQRLSNKYLGFALALLIGAAFSFIGNWIGVDYSWYGVAMVFTAWLFYERFSILAVSWLALNIAYIWPLSFSSIHIQIYSMLALIPIFFYNDRPGKSNRWFFYIFYCAHLGILYLLQQFVF